MTMTSKIFAHFCSEWENLPKLALRQVALRLRHRHLVIGSDTVT